MRPTPQTVVPENQIKCTGKAGKKQNNAVFLGWCHRVGWCQDNGNRSIQESNLIFWPHANVLRKSVKAAEYSIYGCPGILGHHN